MQQHNKNIAEKNKKTSSITKQAADTMASNSTILFCVFIAWIK